MTECALNTGNMPPGGFPRYSVSNRPDTTSAVYSGHLATNQKKMVTLLNIFDNSSKSIAETEVTCNTIDL